MIRRTFPRGLDTEVMPLDVLERVHRHAQSPDAREHVTWYILREHPEEFRVANVTWERDESSVNWSVDTAEDLDRIRAIVSGYSDWGFVPGFRDLLVATKASRRDRIGG